MQRQIARDFDMLEILADGIISDPDIPMKKKIVRIKEQAKKFGLYRIAIVDLEGNATASDGYQFSVADREFFQAAVKGKRFLSQPIIDKVDGVTPGIVYAVPVFHDGEVESVLFSGYELNKLTERIDISFYHESGMAFIVNAKSDVLLHPVANRIGSNMLAVSSERSREAEMERFRSHLENRTPGVAHLVMKEENRFFAYAPIEDGNDWFLVASLPSTIVFERSQTVIVLTVLLLAVISVLLALTALYVVLAEKKANAKIVKLAYYDPLTGASNTERFKLDAGALFQQYGSQRYTLLNFDVKQFRYLNNDLGYEAGNQLLLHIVDCLKKVLQKGETFTRVGTDQFLLLFFSRENEVQLRESIEELRRQIADWQPPGGGYYSPQLAFGVYAIEEENADVMAAIEKSNSARKAAKAGNESEIAIYDGEMQRKIDRNAELEKAMPAALENGEFKLYIQPKYDLITEKIVGGEALVRWIKPDGSVIYPGAFIPL
ncbi:MAG: diguanylate cyclase, partial [Oscillospiraceae bacterium]